MIKKIAEKYFGYIPYVVSTTEHDHPMITIRQLSSLRLLNKRFYNQEILRVIMHDTDQYFEIPEASNKIRKDFTYKTLLKLCNIINATNLSCKDTLSNFSKYEDKICGGDISVVFCYLDHIESLSKYILGVEKALKSPVCLSSSDHLKKWVMISYDNDNITRQTMNDYFEGINIIKQQSKILDYRNIIECYIKDQINLSYKIILISFMNVANFHFGNDYGFVNYLNNRGGSLAQATEYKKDFTYSKQVEKEKVSVVISKFSKHIIGSKKMYEINDILTLSMIYGVDKVISEINTNEEKVNMLYS